MYFMAPAYVANMAPPFSKYWHGWNAPISRRWLGTNKTVVGFLAAVAGAVLTTLVQYLIGWRGSIVDYQHWLTLGVLFGVGTMLGDMAKSFVKRRVGIAPGKSWFPFDQTDFVIGALLFVGWRASLSAVDVVLILALSIVGHIVVNHIGYWLGVRPAKW
ncbi:MAG TPA: CDP-archaeol synthase [Methylomirabilota bacterium]|nr:CDP-archaeol synthase [Methylomirabilota bacterium]